MKPQKRIGSCTSKREICLEIQEGIYPLYFGVLHNGIVRNPSNNWLAGVSGLSYKYITALIPIHFLLGVTQRGICCHKSKTMFEQLFHLSV